MALEQLTAAARAATSELEWQFDALDLDAVDRWLDAECARTDPGMPRMSVRRSPTARRLVDTYFDTADWRIGRGGYVLRERRQRGRLETTMKSLVDVEEGFRNRVEVNESAAVAELAKAGDGAVSWRLRALVGHAQLQPVVEVVTRRRPIEIEVEGSVIGELVLDETSIGAPGARRRLHLRRVELEVKRSGLEVGKRVADAMRAACALSPATLSKFEAGLLGAGLSIPGPPDLGSMHVDVASTIGDLALAAVRRDARAMLAHEPGTRLGEDVEELHQMRVSTRRLRAALSQFAAVLPARAAALKGEIGWLASLLGDVRDLDVQLEQTEAWIADADSIDRPYLYELTERLEGARAVARAELLRSFDSPRYTRLVSGLTTMLRTSSGRRNSLARTPALIAMPALVEERHRSASKAAKRAKRSGVPADFHLLRIRTKRLRYVLEFADGLYGTAGRRYVKLLSSLQSRLGSMQDAEVAADRLRTVALELGDESTPLSLAAVFTVGGLSARYRAESARLLARLADEVGVLSGRGWGRLLASMERQRSDALEVRDARIRRPPLEVAPPITELGTETSTAVPATSAQPVVVPVVAEPLVPVSAVGPVLPNVLRPLQPPST